MGFQHIPEATGCNKTQVSEEEAAGMQGRMSVYVSTSTFYAFYAMYFFHAYINQCSMLCIIFYAQELSSDVMERKKNMTIAKHLLLIVIRIATNTFVFLCLVAGGVAIFYSVQVVRYVLEQVCVR